MSISFIRSAVFLFAMMIVLTSAGCLPSDADMGEAGTPGSGRSNGKDGGTPAPKLIATTELKALDGPGFTIDEYKGKVVLVNLWATWCGPCLEEMPYFIKMQEKYGDQGLQVIGLNSDDQTEAQVRTFVKDQKLNYKIGWSPREVTTEFVKISKLPGIPQTLLINREGEMIGMFRGGGEDVIKTMVETVEKEMTAKS